MNFKGHQTIRPLLSVEDLHVSDGVKWSSLMDVMSFVLKLGVKSAQLRSSQLKGLVYRG